MSLSPSSAGTVMFVYRMHLSREVRTIKGLQKQVNAYLVCLTCLRLIRPEYSWIVQPASGAVGKKCLVTGVLLSWGGFSSQAFTDAIIRHLPNSSLRVTEPAQHTHIRSFNP
ncbi:unnamed protein product [Ranitomeya imitator]|uniref:NUP160 middle TPR domain-containing protein n=1 Tax=Ranitomeya imitator TaxID=111125 RepID=A0ABN9M7I1_9NEOB|nr:unnamed protein product [Ranitomeya imitator]